MLGALIVAGFAVAGSAVGALAAWRVVAWKATVHRTRLSLEKAYRDGADTAGHARRHDDAVSAYRRRTASFPMRQVAALLERSADRAPRRAVRG
jgi:hypothetical protein